MFIQIEKLIERIQLIVIFPGEKRKKTEIMMLLYAYFAINYQLERRYTVSFCSFNRLLRVLRNNVMLPSSQIERVNKQHYLLSSRFCLICFRFRVNPKIGVSSM